MPRQQSPRKDSSTFFASPASVGKAGKEILDKGLEASKKWFESARKTISEWGDESVKQVEIAKLNSRLEKGYKALGKLVFAKLAGKKGTVSVSTDDEEIGEAVKLLSDMAKQIKKLGGTPSSATGKAASRKKTDADTSKTALLPAPKAKASTGSKKAGTAAKERSTAASSKKTTSAKSKATAEGKKTASKKSSSTKSSAKGGSTAKKTTARSSKKAQA